VAQLRVCRCGIMDEEVPPLPGTGGSNHPLAYAGIREQSVVPRERLWVRGGTGALSQAHVRRASEPVPQGHDSLRLLPEVSPKLRGLEMARVRVYSGRHLDRSGASSRGLGRGGGASVLRASAAPSCLRVGAGPCATCPYLREARVGLWHRSEFEKLLRADGDSLGGAMFQCHGDGKKASGDRKFCSGGRLSPGSVRNHCRLQLRAVPLTGSRLAPRPGPTGAAAWATASDAAARCPSTGTTVARSALSGASILRKSRPRAAG
jgi:hypothetical protein